MDKSWLRVRAFLDMKTGLSVFILKRKDLLEGNGCILLVSRPDPPISAALDVLHHQHAERKVWKLLHGFLMRLECT